MRSDLPAGTVTFLFTDIEGSTQLLHELGDVYAEALAEHRRVLREAFVAHGGVEVDTQGDAFFVAFTRATDALAAATDGQRSLAGGPVRVRMGLHTGEPSLTGEGYIGVDVHRGARIAAAGHGGQVLLSESTRTLVEGDVRDLGEHRLKDLLVPQRLFQLGDEEFPPVKSLNWTNLPVQTTPLVGRQRELEEANALLRNHRLLTLVGPPGTGKTRLALQLAAEVADGFDHVWWVPLQDIRDPDLVEPAIAHAVGARAGLESYLLPRHALLLLDNLEQVVAFAPRLAVLVASAAGLRVIVTSREPMRLTLEQQYPVPPLPEADASVLFAERARAVRPDFVVDTAVTEICRRLDGLPLAIELAAPRVKLFSTDALLARLAKRLPLLVGGARDLPARQQTLRATLAWSYELLTPREQEQLALLSVFEGGWTLGAAETICDCDLETVGSLVDKSLLREQDGRFTMLDTVREFAADLLGERPDADALRRRHAESMLAEAEQQEMRRSSLAWVGDADVAWFAREHENLRAALDWFRSADEAEPELRLALACRDFWASKGHWSEGRRYTESALSRAREARRILVARALESIGSFAWRQGDFERGRDLSEQALALHRQIGTRGAELLWSRVQLGVCELNLGNVERALELYDEARRVADETDDERALAVIANNQGNVALVRGDLTRAADCFAESVPIFRRLGATTGLANALIDVGFVALAEHRLDDAAASLHESLSICREHGLPELMLFSVEGLAAVAIAHDAASRAARLLAAMTRLREELIVGGYYPIGDEFRARSLVAAEERLGAAAFAAAWADGAALSAEAAAAEAALVD